MSEQIRIIFVLSLGLMACTASPEGEEDASNCTVPEDPASVFGDISHTRSETISTVFQVNWSPGQEGTSWIRYGLPDAQGREIAPSMTDAGVESLLLGLKASTDYAFQVILETEDGDLCSEPETITTGPLPATLPIFEHESFLPEDAAGGFTVIPANDDLGVYPYRVILDDDGDPVWFSLGQTNRARPSVDGEFLLSLIEAEGPGYSGSIQKTPLYGGEQVNVTAVGIHMDFVEVEPSVYASFGWDVHEYEDGARLIAGESILEFTKDGETREVWKLYDYFQPDTSEKFDADISCCPEIEDWAHLNFLSYSAEEDAYYASSRYLRTVFKIDRSSGELLWSLSGRSEVEINSFAWPVGGSITFNPHSVIPTDTGVLIFASGTPSTGDCSAASEFRLDTTNWEAERLGYYATEDCQISYQMGNSTELWNGNRTLVLATGGQIDEFNPENELVSRLVVSQGYWLGFSSRLPDMVPSSAHRPTQ
jgi:hypothetical protein